MSYLLSILPGNPVLPSGLSIALRVSLQTLDASGRVVDVKDIRGAALSAQSAKGVNVSITPDSYVVQASWAAPATPGGDLPSVTIQAKYQSADGSIMAQGSTTLMVAEADATKDNVLLVHAANGDTHLITMTNAWSAYRLPATPGDLQPFLRSGTFATPIVETPAQLPATEAPPTAVRGGGFGIVPGITCILLNLAALPTPPTP